MKNPWQDDLLAARSEDEIVSVVQRYLASFAPAVLELLPDACRSPDVSGGDRLVEATVEIVKAEWSVPRDDAAAKIVKDIARTFTLAHDRIRELRGRAATIARG